MVSELEESAWMDGVRDFFFSIEALQGFFIPAGWQHAVLDWIACKIRSGLFVDYDHGAMITVGHPWVEQDGLVFTPGRLVPSTTVPLLRSPTYHRL